MAKAKIASLDGISEELQKEYAKQDDGSYLLIVDSVDGYELANTTNLKSALNKERDSGKELKTALKKTQDVLKSFEGIDPETARTAIEKMDKWDETNINKEKEMERKISALAKDFEAKHNAVLEPLKKRDSVLTGKIKKLLIDNVAISEIKKEDGDADLLLPHVRAIARVAEKDDDFVLEVLNDRGELDYDGSGKNKTIADVVKGFKVRFPGAFKGTGNTGTGSKPPTGGQKPGGKQISRAEFNNLDEEARASFFTSDGKPTGNTVID